MVGGKRQAMDSVHVKANASMDSLRGKKIVQDGDAYVGELRGEGTEDEDPRPPNTVSAYKHQQVEWHHKWKDKTYRNPPGGRDVRARVVSKHTH